MTDPFAALSKSLKVLSPKHFPVLLGFSGGLDSTVLLEASISVLSPHAVVAWHVHHGLCAAADAWVSHCKQQAAQRGVRFGVTRVGAAEKIVGNVEGWARKRRYQALVSASVACKAGAILTAHHADDQIETVLMKLSRGAGPVALSGMSPASFRDNLWLLRPFLDLFRTDLLSWAKQRGLSWIEDPDNVNPNRFRTVLRQSILPAWRRVAPGMDAGILRSAALLKEVHSFGTVLSTSVCGNHRVLDMSELLALPESRRLSALHDWCRRVSGISPTGAAAKEWLRQLVSSVGSLTGVQTSYFLGNLRFRYYKGRLWAGPKTERDWSINAPPGSLRRRWSGEPFLPLPGWQGRLYVSRAGQTKWGVPYSCLFGKDLEVQPPSMSIRLRPKWGQASRSLKNLFQESARPPWVRPGFPMVLLEGQLLYVAGLGMNYPLSTLDAWHRAPQESGGNGVVFSWEPDSPGDLRADAFNGFFERKKDECSGHRDIL